MINDFRSVKAITHKEFITTVRDKTFAITWIIFLLLLVTATLTGAHHYERETTARQHTEQLFRKQWLQQDPKHPHIAAHFGNFAIMPLTALSLFDRGLDAFSGKVVYLEPHKQNDFSFKPSEEQDGSLRFGELTIALILQLLFPLFIIFTCFDSFTKEKQTGNLKMLYSQGLSFTTIYTGKFLGRLLTVLLLYIPCVISVGCAMLYVPSTSTLLPQISILLLLYFLYLALITAVAILVSAFSKSSRGAVLSLISIWIVMAILLPKWTANAGNNFYPLPTKYEFNTAIRTDIDKGLNGHDPKSARAEAIKKQLLEKYHVDTVSKLPFNYEGYIMQAGEEYSSLVYDTHFSRLQQTLNHQNQLGLRTSIVDPYMAIRNLSMALCGTDYYSHLDFQQQAEQYRRKFVQQMNGDMKDHSAMGDWSYKSDTAVFASVLPFHYKAPDIASSLKHYTAGFISFFIWIVAVCAGVYVYNKNN